MGFPAEFRTVPSRAIVMASAVLAALALALTIWFVVGLGVQKTNLPTNDRPYAVGAEQVGHNQSEEGFATINSTGGEQVTHNRSEEGLSGS